ncbi:MAG TPA: UvrD-helicase domain-containing protein [Candidatus Paceibacterota bacterium]
MELNSKQKEAVETSTGPVLVVAGAGAGKTRVITERIKRLIEKGMAPEKILAVTFTNKAAEEMRERLTPYPLLIAPFIGTFHQLGLLIIKENLRTLGIGKYFSILDEDDSLDLLKNCQKELNIDPKQYDPRKFKNKISGMKNILLTHEVFEETSLWEDFAKRVWSLYEAKKKIQNALDFDDLLLIPTNFLRFNEKALLDYQNRWQFIHIDEYQDTNEAQYVLSKLLASVHKNIFAVGDIDQAIYSWRGADFRNILNFQKDYPEAKIITLEQNYRSTDIVLEAANAVILNNKSRLPKNLVAQKQGKELIKVIFGSNERNEAQKIAQEILRLSHLALGELSEIAILYRTNAQSRVLEEAMLANGIPYKVIGGFRFYERKEVKDVLAYAKLVQNPNDLQSKKRILNTPPRGIGKTLMLKVLGGINLEPADTSKVNVFNNIIDSLRENEGQNSAFNFLKILIKKIKYEEYINDGTEKGVERWQNVMELLTIAKSKPNSSLSEFLEHVSLFSAEDKMSKNQEKVSLMTTHMAKGLEFETIFVSGLEEGLFPHNLSIEPNKVEEERRLFYVALTRAKTNLYLTLTARRTIFGNTDLSVPSRFLREIPEYLLAYIGQPKNYEIEENIYVE